MLNRKYSCREVLRFACFPKNSACQQWHAEDPSATSLLLIQHSYKQSILTLCRATRTSKTQFQPLTHLFDSLHVTERYTPISRDAQLVEPLTRSWNTPRHWLLAPPLLKPGRNTLLVRVSGIAAYQPGLGPFTLGEPPQSLCSGEDGMF